VCPRFATNEPDAERCVTTLAEGGAGVGDGGIHLDQSRNILYGKKTTGMKGPDGPNVDDTRYSVSVTGIGRHGAEHKENCAVKQNLSTVLADLGHTAKGALFLNRLLYWWPKAVVLHDGEFWLYRHGRQEWADEINTPLRTFKRIVNLLQADGLIETRQFQLLNRTGRSYGPKVSMCGRPNIFFT